MCPCCIICSALQAFEEAELPKLKQDKPGLTHTQYKDLIWKLWKKSPDIPLNQVSIHSYPLTCHTIRILNFVFNLSTPKLIL